MITLKDIARACGVSTSTVSRALNGIEMMRPDLAKEIRQTAQEMGYAPNAIARTLKNNRSWMIGVLFESPLSHPFFPLVLDAIRWNAEKRGYDVLLLSRTSQNGHVEYSETCLSRRMDGVVLVYTNVDTQGVNRIISSSIPVVTLDEFDMPCDVVLSDYGDGTRQLVEMAVQRGHRKIAFLHGQIGYATRERIAAFRETMAAHGLAVPEEYLRQVAFNDGERCADETLKLLRSVEAPTCVLMPDDFAALKALQILAAQGVTAPRDFSCMGYDGIGWADDARPRLTTYQQNVSAIGEAVFETLLHAIEERANHQRSERHVHGRLIPGETVAWL